MRTYQRAANFCCTKVDLTGRAKAAAEEYVAFDVRTTEQQRAVVCTLDGAPYAFEAAADLSATQSDRARRMKAVVEEDPAADLGQFTVQRGAPDLGIIVRLDDGSFEASGADQASGDIRRSQ